MKSIPALALAASLALIGFVAAAPATAQEPAQAQAAQRKFNISKEAARPISDLQAAVNAKNNAAVPALLAAAEAVAKNSDEKYLIARFRLEHAGNVKDQAAASAAIDAVIASGGADAAELARLKQAQLSLAAQGGDFKAAEQLYAARLAANANDLDALQGLARAKLELKKEGEALDLLQQAISVSKAGGQPAKEAWYRKALEIAHNQGNRTLALQLSQEVQTLFPSAENFKNMLAVHQNGARMNPEDELDFLRLLRASKSLTRANDYLALADLLDRGSYYGEVQDVAREAVGAGASTAALGEAAKRAAARTAEDKAALAGLEGKARADVTGNTAFRVANGYFGHGHYGKAVEFYRLAAERNQANAPVANTRIGIALAQQGQRAEAEAAFKAVTGPRAELAGLWLTWLAQKS